MLIKILGLGCPNCQKLTQNVKQACKELGLKDFKIEKVTDFEKITAYGVLSLPGLVIDEKVKPRTECHSINASSADLRQWHSGARVKSFGKVLSIEEAKKILKEYV